MLTGNFLARTDLVLAFMSLNSRTPGELSEKRKLIPLILYDSGEYEPDPATKRVVNDRAKSWF